MSRSTLIDTGPIVAIFSQRDHYHRVCVEQLKQLRPPLLTCWPVVTEVAWLLRSQPAVLETFYAAFDGGLFQILDISSSELPEIGKIQARYAKLGLQLADAALIHLARRESIDTVFTLDHRDFSIVRTRGRAVLNLIPMPLNR